MPAKLKIISLFVDPISFDCCLQTVLKLGQSNTPSFVCFANAHMVVEAYKDSSFADQLSDATLVVTDGKPLTIACRWLFRQKQQRICGMDFMPQLLQAAGPHGLNIFLYGSTKPVLETLKQKINEKYPLVNITGLISPPFGEISQEDQQQHIKEINDSGAQLVLVSLGCPKQEKWMATNYKNINAVLLGLGGAFMVSAELQNRSPEWMQKNSLEWLYRLMQEPGRLFVRYFKSNFLFLWLLGKEIVKKKFA